MLSAHLVFELKQDSIIFESRNIFVVSSFNLVIIIDPTYTVPTDGNWGDWMDLTACSQTCGGGKMKRHRKCDNPSPSNGGKPCQGSSMKAVDCNTQSCTGEDAYSTLLLLT